MARAIFWILLGAALVGIGYCTQRKIVESRFEDAIEAGDEPKVRAFLDERPDLVHYTRTGRRSSTIIYTPLGAAARRGHAAVVALLLDRGAGINDRGRGGETALQEGIDRPEVVSLLVARGAAVNVRDYHGGTPLHDAGYDGATTRLLLEKGADVNARDAHGRTPLHDQSNRFTPESTVEICAHGAYPAARDKAGLTPAAMSDPWRRPWLSPEGTCGRLSARFRRDRSVPPEVVTAALHELRCLVLPRQMKTHQYPLAESKMAWSCAELGRRHEEGEGVDKDMPRALDLYRLACEGGDKWACDRRGVLVAWIAAHKGWLESQKTAGAVTRP